LKNEAGCTGLICLITEKIIYIANAGDSRAIGKINNKIECLTEDHNP
jgi:serine/threonine protein phosphatase PrpC